MITPLAALVPLPAGERLTLRVLLGRHPLHHVGCLGSACPQYRLLAQRIDYLDEQALDDRDQLVGGTD